MTNAAAKALQEHPAFAGLSDAVLNAIQQDASLLDFQPGQPLSAGDVIPHQVLLILSGQARLLVRHRERTQTLRKAGAGELVGLASVVRAAGCEAVTASTPVQRWPCRTGLFFISWKQSQAFARSANRPSGPPSSLRC